jgi:hypothetical protein
MESDKQKKIMSSGTKILFTLLFLVIFSTSLLAESGNGISNRVVDGGIGLGAVIAVVASWSRNQSVLRAIFHGILSWFYVLYFVLTRESR